ncbi:MAG TPA: hypothetical protein VIK92_10100, partial [Thermaerobacter sp.]
PALFLSESAAAVGIAVINSIGNLGGFVGPYVVGLLNNATGSVTAGLLFLSASLLVTGLLVFAIRKGHAHPVPDTAAGLGS